VLESTAESDVEMTSLLESGFIDSAVALCLSTANGQAFDISLKQTRVHFSPLAWSEVKDFVHHWDHPDPVFNNFPCAPPPQLIARVWIIKPGKKAEPDQQHQCWLKVKNWDEGDPDWVAQVETMWKMVRGHLLKQGYEPKYKLCMADDSLEL
jgi:hypothetical protein